MEDFNFWQFVTEKAIEYAPKVLLALLTLIIGWIIIGWITRLAKKYMARHDVEMTLRPFFGSLISIGLKVLLIISVAGIFGVKTASFIAVLGAAAFAIGLALQGTLGHFASGVLILVFKPYRVGDLVSIQGQLGKVKEILLFNTVLLTADNKTVIIPNGVVTSGVITNVTTEGTLRCDVTFGIGYTDDIDKARQVMLDIILKNDKILKDPAPGVFVSELADSSVNFVVTPWCNASDFLAVKFYLHEEVKKAFDAQGISIPFPQMDVHVNQN